MGNPFVWLSRADLDILNFCRRLRNTERIKFAGFGTLVLIPAVLAFPSMSYAVSTISNNPLIFIPAGVVWSLIVLCIDMFLVSTFYKSSITERSEYISKAALFICRLIFAGFIGLAVSHPFMLFYFHQSIEQMIAEKKHAALESIRVKADNEKIQVNTRSSTLNLTTITNYQNDLKSIKDELRSKQEKQGCLKTLRRYEEDGKKVVGEGLCSGLSTTGQRYCRTQCMNFQDQIDQLETQINQLDKEREALEKKINQESNRFDEREIEESGIRKKRLQDIEDTAAKSRKDIEEKHSEDYLARVDALAEIESGKPHVRMVRQFILILFVFIDISPILMKLLAPVGEYEQLRDTLLFEVKTSQEMERGLIYERYNNPFNRAIHQTKFTMHAKFDELIALMQLTNDFLNDMEKKRQEFERKMSEISESIKKVTDEERRKNYGTYLTEAGTVFSETWRKSRDRFLEFIEKS